MRIDYPAMPKPTLIVLVVVVLALAAALMLWRDDAPVSLSAAVESHASRVLGTRVDVDSADIDWETGAVTVTNLRVANPGGFSDSDMITVASARAEGDLRNGVVRRLVFEDMEALIEFRGTGSNFEVVGERAADNTDGQGGPGEESGDGEGAAEEEATDPDDGSGPEAPEDWRVERVAFEDVQVTVRADWTDEEVAYQAGGLVLENLDGRLDDLTRSVVLGFLSNVLSTGAEQVDNSRLRESLLERAGELRDRIEAREGGE